jgi:hypothetical protein
MKITSIEIHPAGSSDICVMSFRDPRRLNPYNVKGISGLDADEIVSKFYGASGDSSQRYYNLTVPKRDIGILVELNPIFEDNESYSELRDGLYKMIASSRTGLVQIIFKDGLTSVAGLSGYIKKMEAGVFTKNPEVSMTIECSDPMLKALERVELDVEDFGPPSVNIPDTLSTAPHGFTFELEFTAPVAAFGMSDLTPIEWAFAVAPNGGFLTGDVLHFSSEYNNKYLYIMRALTQIHIADKIAAGSNWPVLFPGDNEFQVYILGDDYTWLSIAHYPTYWGV